MPSVWTSAYFACQLLQLMLSEKVLFNAAERANLIAECVPSDSDARAMIAACVAEPTDECVARARAYF